MCRFALPMEIFGRRRWTTGSAPLGLLLDKGFKFLLCFMIHSTSTKNCRWNVSMYVLHPFLYVLNTTAYYSIGLPLSNQISSAFRKKNTELFILLPRNLFHEIFNGPTPASFCLFSFFSNTNLAEKTVDVSGIRTRIVGVEVKYTDHLTTTTAQALFVYTL